MRCLAYHLQIQIQFCIHTDTDTLELGQREAQRGHKYGKGTYNILRDEKKTQQSERERKRGRQGEHKSALIAKQ